MRRFIPFLALVAVASQGCIIYESDCDDCGWDWETEWEDDWCSGDGTGEDGSCDDQEDERPTFSLGLSVDRAEQGETFLTTLTARGEFDMGSVASVEFIGGPVVRWTELRQDGLMLLVDVPADAVPGDMDLIVTRTEDASVVVQGALYVGEAGSGTSANDCE
ncbi:MAG: hypothetical protein ACI9MC_001546 [Kiritimatiellia bacterium]|jgi:hypothetical protein